MLKYTSVIKLVVYILLFIIYFLHFQLLISQIISINDHTHLLLSLSCIIVLFPYPQFGTILFFYLPFIFLLILPHQTSLLSFHFFALSHPPHLSILCFPYLTTCTSYLLHLIFLCTHLPLHHPLLPHFPSLQTLLPFNFPPVPSS